MTNLPNHEKYRDAVENFDAKAWLLERSTVAPSGCREWGRARNKGGYGIATVRRGFALYAHRLAYWAFIGPLTDDRVVDHMCHNRGCLEPTHLRLLTLAENVADSHSANKSHCIRGHELTESNVYINAGRRSCRTCNAAKAERANAAHKAKRHTAVDGAEMRQAALSAA